MKDWSSETNKYKYTHRETTTKLSCNTYKCGSSVDPHLRLLGYKYLPVKQIDSLEHLTVGTIYLGLLASV